MTFRERLKKEIADRFKKYGNWEINRDMMKITGYELDKLIDEIIALIERKQYWELYREDVSRYYRNFKNVINK